MLLTRQAGQMFKARGTHDLVPVLKQPLPPLAQAIALSDGGIVALGLAGAIRAQGAAQ
jgi:hypothetical protein